MYYQLVWQNERPVSITVTVDPFWLMYLPRHITWQRMKFRKYLLIWGWWLCLQTGVCTWETWTTLISFACGYLHIWWVIPLISHIIWWCCMIGQIIQKNSRIATPSLTMNKNKMKRFTESNIHGAQLVRWSHHNGARVSYQTDRFGFL
jgi:hypothetical protein